MLPQQKDKITSLAVDPRGEGLRRPRRRPLATLPLLGAALFLRRARKRDGNEGWQGGKVAWVGNKKTHIPERKPQPRKKFKLAKHSKQTQCSQHLARKPPERGVGGTSIEPEVDKPPTPCWSDCCVCLLSFLESCD